MSNTGGKNIRAGGGMVEGKQTFIVEAVLPGNDGQSR